MQSFQDADDDSWKLYENPSYVAAVASEASLNQHEEDEGDEIQEKHCYQELPRMDETSSPSTEIRKTKASATKATAAAGQVHEKDDEKTNQKLRLELMDAWATIQKLEKSHGVAQAKLSNLSIRLERGRSSRESEFQDKVSSSLQSLKQKLREERGCNVTISAENSKLEEELSELRKAIAEAKRSTAMDVKARKVVEGVCDELAKEVGGDKSKVVELRDWSAATKKEAEDARKAMQMAEVWKEEKVQSRLADSRFSIEQKCFEMDELISRIEEFLSSRTEKQDDVTPQMGDFSCGKIDETRTLLLNGSRFHTKQPGKVTSRGIASASRSSATKLPRMWPSTSLRSKAGSADTIVQDSMGKD